MANEKISSREPIQGFEELCEHADKLAESPWQPSPALPECIANLTYDKYRMIAFRHDKAIWRSSKSPFWLEMFHRGFVHREKVALNVLEGDKEQPLLFDRKMFEYRGPMSKCRPEADTGFAGLRVVGRFPGYKDLQEMLTFLGGSYFRARTASTVYGSSARALAINVGTAGREEFPAFREFWVVKPETADTSLTILALLDSESVTGAYQFQFVPDEAETTIDVKATLYFRSKPEKVALAPMTSMWMWGDGLDAPPGDSRPEVHDADGLLVLDQNQQWSWRALSRQSYPSLSKSACPNPLGFGLIQRDCEYGHYLDDEAQYHRRPSLWIQPKSTWGDGDMELLELPGAHEGIDNIAAYWVPRNPIPVQTPFSLEFSVRFCRGNPAEHNFLAHATDSNVYRNEDGTFNVEIHFAGPALQTISSETPVNLEISTVRGVVTQQEVRPAETSERIAILTIKPESQESVELRVTLMDCNRILSENWTYLCSPTPPPYQFPQVFTRKE